MLTPEKKSILQLLTALAWADGRVDTEEQEVVEALLDAFGAEAGEAEELRAWAKEPRTLDSVDLSGLARTDVQLALQHGVLLTYIDGEQSESEKKLIGALVDKLGLSTEEAAPLLESANAFAKQLLHALES
ncbi:MAG: TerB family tellurite resistance protein [Proteobacteria bacterium]|jgi:tellurite resistance protein|nr:TerB family tellurite resistance protein [Pseudomonadota bacterium]